MKEYRKLSGRVTCPECDGEGVMWTGGWSYKKESPTEKRCELCDGKGTVSQDKAKAHRGKNLGR